jgi:hypothetical protein
MLHDFDVKSDRSYGTGTRTEIVQQLRSQGVTSLAFTDLFTISDIEDYPSFKGSRIYTGSEWYVKCDSFGVERIDLVFLNYTPTNLFKAWSRREIIRMGSKWEHAGLSVKASLSDSFMAKSNFGRELSEKGLRRAYFGALPILEQVVTEFQKVGAHFILSGIPFVGDFSYKCKIVRYLKTLGLMGLIVFKSESEYDDLEKEIQESIDLCIYAGILPIVGSGVHDEYNLRKVACGTALRAFDNLTRQIIEKLDRGVLCR